MERKQIFYTDDTGAHNAKRETGLFSIFNRFMCANVYARHVFGEDKIRVLVRLKILHESVCAIRRTFC